MPIKNAPAAAEFKAPEPVNTPDQAEPVDQDVTPDETVKTNPAESIKPDAEPVDDFTFVRMPDGSVRAVRKADIQNINTFDRADGTPEVPVQDVYVHLANGDVERMPESKLPGAAGTNAPFGYFERDGKVHHIVGVYPVEHDKA